MKDTISGGRSTIGTSKALMALTGAMATCAAAPATATKSSTFDMLSTTASSFNLDLNGDGVTDFMLTSGGGSNAIALVGTGTNSTESFAGDAARFSDRSSFTSVKSESGSVPLISTNGNMEGNSIFASGWQPGDSSSVSGYAEVYFTDNGVQETGYVGGTMTQSTLGTGATDETFALTSYGVDAAPAAPEPETWALFIVGAGITGAALCRRRRSAPMQLLAA